MPSLAILQHLDVHNIAFIARNGDTVCNLVANGESVFFVASLAITQNGAGSTGQYLIGWREQKNWADVENVWLYSKQMQQDVPIAS